jgi:hypothetical protein
LNRGAAAVRVTYKNLQKPVLTVRDGIQDPKRVGKPLKIPPRPKNIRKIFVAF